MSVRRLDEHFRHEATEHLARFPRRALPLEDRRHAAVVIALVDDDDGRACFVLTRRAARMRRHAGQWALPGGRLDAGETPVAAALRELHEEVGLESTDSECLGTLDDYPTRSGFIITPIVVWGGPEARLTADPAEVAEIHRVPIDELDRPGVPQIRSIPESDRPVISIPLVGTQIHAPTAAILFQLREVMLRGLSTRVEHYEQPIFAWR
ncbi:MAG: NUDIX hydrolase [Myxococcota bacterium]